MPRQHPFDRSSMLVAAALAALAGSFALWSYLSVEPLEGTAGIPRASDAVLDGSPVPESPLERREAPMDASGSGSVGSAPIADSSSNSALPAEPSTPRGSLSGLLVDALDNGSEGIPVHLSSSAEHHSSTRTDVLGRFHFEGLARGSWTLRVGSRIEPWVPPSRVEIPDGPLQLEPLALPPLGSVELRILDSFGAPVPDVRVHSLEEYELESDAEGRCLVPALPGGLHRFYAKDEVLGRGTVVFELEPGERITGTIVLRTADDR